MFKGKRTLVFPHSQEERDIPPLQKVAWAQSSLGSRVHSTFWYSPLKPTAMKRAAGDRLSDVAKYGKEIFMTTYGPATETAPQKEGGRPELLQ